MCVVRHMLYGSFGIQNLAVTSISKFDPRKDKYHAKLGQIRSFFQIWKCAYKYMPILFRLFRDSKNTIHFYVRQVEMQKKAFQKLTSSPLHDCLEIAHPKIKILAWKFACVLFIRILMMHIPVFFFFDVLNILNFVGNYYWKIEIVGFGGLIEKYRKLDVAIL